MNRVQSIKHLGITYQENGKINIEERLSIGRRTIYALLGTAYVFQIFSRTTGDIPDLACSPGPSKTYIVRLPILNHR
jgi:hypothetical protein